MFGEGISKEGELVDYGVKLDVIDKSGAWFSFEDMKLGQGRENVKHKFKEDPLLASSVEVRVKALMNKSNIMIMSQAEVAEADVD
jgi:recombination protein RecA